MVQLHSIKRDNYLVTNSHLASVSPTAKDSNASPKALVLLHKTQVKQDKDLSPLKWT